MTRIFHLLIFISCNIGVVSGQTINSKSLHQRTLSFDTSKIAIIPFNYRDFYGEVDGSNSPDTLTQQDIFTIDSILRRSVIEHDSSLRGRDKNAYFIDLSNWNYRRQYVCYRNSMNEKIVYVDCFCSALGNNWKKHLMIVDDGGRCFFNVKINLTHKTYFDFFVNGYA